MTGGWKFTAVTIILSMIGFGIGVGCAGLLSAPDRITRSLIGGLCVSMLGAPTLAVCYYVKLRRHLETYLDRPSLSDKEFAALFPSDAGVDLDVVHEVREMAGRRFWSIGGDRFYPRDRLEADLHLSDVAPWALEDFWCDLEEYLHAEETDAPEGTIITFGDVVLVANQIRSNRNHTA